MDAEQRDSISATLAAFPEVKWDRMVSWAEGTEVYGWVAREDGRSDFVLLAFDFKGPLTIGITTSSAEHSETFYTRLFGTLAGHVHCERVADVLGELRR
jgi:hypothetical protein